MGRRFFRHGELHLVVLSLLSRRGMHGYELMCELGRLFGPSYRPSAGSIYPAVQSLEVEGLIKAVEGDHRVYRLTPSGRAALRQRVDALTALEVRTGVRLGSGGGPDAALVRFASRVRNAAPRIDPDDLERLLDRAASELEALAAPSRPPNPTPPGATAT